MRILLICVDFTPLRDGVSCLSHHYARRLAERGHAVLVIAPRVAGDREEDARAPYRTVRVRGAALGYGRFFPFALASLAAMARWRPDLVLPMNIGYGGVLCFALSLVGACRYVAFAYAYEFLKFRRVRPLRALYRAIYRRAEFVIAISEFTRRELTRFGADAAHIRVAYPGMCEAQVRADAAAVRAGPRVIGTCGRLVPRKGHDLVIRALPRVLTACPDAEYRVAGEGPAEAHLRRLARELGVESRVHFLGLVPPQSLDAFYAGLDVFAMPAREDPATGHVEGFGIVYLEAARLGVPSVATPTGGIPEAVLDGVTGILVPPESPDALADALIGLLTDRARRNALGQAARARADAEFTWNRQVDRAEEWMRYTTNR